MLVVEAHACTAVHGRVHACHLFTTLHACTVANNVHAWRGGPRLHRYHWSRSCLLLVHNTSDRTIVHVHACLCLLFSTTLMHSCWRGPHLPSAWSSPAPRRVPRLYVTTAIPSIISMVMLMPGVWLMPAQFFMCMLMPGVWLMPAQFYGHGHAHACHLFTTLMPARLLMFMPASACCMHSCWRGPHLPSA